MPLKTRNNHYPCCGPVVVVREDQTTRRCPNCRKLWLIQRVESPEASRLLGKQVWKLEWSEKESK